MSSECGGSPTFHSRVLVTPCVSGLWWTGQSLALVMRLGDDEVPPPWGTLRKQGYSTHLIYFARKVASLL